MYNNVFKIAILMSITGHCLFIFGLSGLDLNKKAISKKDIEVAYVQIKQMQMEIKKDKEKILKYHNKDIVSVSQDKDKIDISQKTKFEIKTKPTQKKVCDVKKEASEKTDTYYSNKIKHATKKEAYLDYYQMLRERIKLFATNNYPSDSIEGEVAVTFVLFNDGRLKSINVIDDKSVGNLKLRNAAVNSIKEASPFPAFPKQLQNSELAFNIVVSFELKK